MASKNNNYAPDVPDAVELRLAELAVLVDAAVAENVRLRERVEQLEFALALPLARARKAG